jgi:signal transduction histidine kinase
VGIQGMRERVRQFHGEMDIDSDENGTRITAVLPAKTKATPTATRVAS